MDVVEESAGATEEQERFFSGLAHRELIVARHRIVAEQPSRLVDVGIMLGVSRERVRQLAAAIRKQWLTAFLPASRTHDVVTEIQRTIGPVASVPSLTSRISALGRSVPMLEVPLWRILAALHPGLAAEGEWVTSPNVDAAVRQTRTLAVAMGGVQGHATVSALREALGLGPETEDVTKWLKRSGLRVHGDTVYSPRVSAIGVRVKPPSSISSMKTRLVNILETAAMPMSARQLAETLGGRVTQESVVGTMGGYEEFSRVDLSLWGLTSWGMPHFTNFRDAIADTLDDNDGRMPLNDLVTSLTRRFAVAASSVRRHAAQAPFRVRYGVISYRSAKTATTTSAKHSYRNLYRSDSGWRYAVVVTDHLLRGASHSVTNRLAWVLGCRQGGQIRLGSRFGEQAIRWTSRQPYCATIRRFLLDLSAKDGDLVSLHFSEDKTFDITTADPAWRNGPPLVRLLALIGAPTDDSADIERALGSIAKACELSADADVDDILIQLRSRGGPELAGLLKQSLTSRP